MAQVLAKGTAWERSLEDYAYVASLDRLGWAWEFLRRNLAYQADWQRHKASMPKLIQHPSGVSHCKLKQSCGAAEHWGLCLFIDPAKTTLETGVHWHLNATVRHVHCCAKPMNDNHRKADTLSNFNGCKHLLRCGELEYVIVQNGALSARLVVKGGSFLKGEFHLTYQIEGLERLVPITETLHNLRRLQRQYQPKQSSLGQSELRLRECLVALDGHLDERSYRDIAEVLYGAARVRTVWTNETRHLKDKVRRAVAAGLSYMNGGYHKLLQ